MTGIIDIGTIEPAVLVLGAGGKLGRGVVQAAVEAGRPVIAVTHDGDALSALRSQFPDAGLRTLDASVASDGDAAELAARLRALGFSLAGVVACIAGEHPCGRLTEQPADVLRRTLDQDLMPHLFAARHLFPLLPQDGRHGYVLIGGPGANYPWAGYGHCSIAAAALRMMARVLHDEAGRHGLRVQLLSLDAPVGTDADVVHAGAALPRAVSIGRRALSMLGAARDATVAAVVDLEAQPGTPAKRATPRGQPPPHAIDHVPAREFRDARALLSSLYALPPLFPGRLHDETC